MNPDEENQNMGDTTESESSDTTGESAETIALKREEYDTFIKDRETLGGLKRDYKKLERELAALRNPEKQESKSSSEGFGLLQKTYLRAAGIVAEDEVELARDIQKRTGVEWDRLPDDDYFQMRLEKLRNAKANTDALKVRGGTAKSGIDETPESFLKRGAVPTEKDIPDRKKRAEIVRAMLHAQKNAGGKFYNE